MISVIIPVYNMERYLSRCLDAVLCSTNPDFELLLINDGSTDRSLEICVEYARRDSRIRLFSQENQGVSAARNRGLEECAGEWVVFVDADDIISPAFLALIAAEDYGAQDMLLFDFARTEQDLLNAGKQSGAPKKIRYSKEEMLDLFRATFCCGQLVENGNVNLNSSNARAFKRAIIHEHAIRFSPQLIYGEDTVFDIEYQLKAENCVYIPAPVYLYNMHADSSSHRIDCQEDNWIERINKAERIKRALEKSGIFSQLERDYYSYALDDLEFILVWMVFNPDSIRTYQEKRYQCMQLRQNETCRQALRWNWRCGPLHRRFFLLPFQIRCYSATSLLCRLSCWYLKKRKFSRK